MLFTLTLLEGGLQVASWRSLTVRRALAPPWIVNSPVVADAHLGWRGNPLHVDHDLRGYRNERALDRADIVALGDSQTYGLVEAPLAWPRLLSAHLGATVYNMALPGYGPMQSELQLDDALALRPRLVIVAPYFGNDLYDSFKLSRRHPEMLTGISPVLRTAADAVDRDRPFEQEMLTLRSASEVSEQHEPAGRWAWISEHSKLYGLLRGIKVRLQTPQKGNPLLSKQFNTAAAALTPFQREYASAEEGTEWRTILTPKHRLRALDDHDPRIRLGFEAMRAALLRMAEKCRSRGIRFLVVLVPTKESVFWVRVKNPSIHPGLSEQVSTEHRLRGELMTALVERRIEFIDLLDALRKAPDQPYHEDIDGHPNRVGNHVIEAAVAERLRNW